MEKDYRDTIQDILDSIDEIYVFIGQMSREEFLNDRKTVKAVLRNLEIMGEAGKKIPPPLRDKYPDIPWKKMTGLRDKLIHEYFGVDLEIIWQLLKEELPGILHPIQEMLRDLNNA
jgi:uncharacterized protein with HEPN domain